MPSHDRRDSPRTDEPSPAPRPPAPAPAGARIGAGTLAAAAQVTRHHVQRLETHRRAAMAAPDPVRDDARGERA